MFFSRYLRSELSKQEQSSSEVVRSLLGKSPKKEEKQIEVTSPKKEEGQVLESVECNSSKLEEEQFVTKPTSDQEDIKVKMVEPVVKEGSEICKPQMIEGETIQKHVTAQTGSPSNGPSLGASSNTACNGGSPPAVSGAIPRIEVFEADLPSQIEAPVIHTSPNGLPKHITSSTSSPVAPSPSRIPSRQQPTSTSSTQQSSPNSSQGHSPVGLQGAGQPFDLKAGQVGGQEELRKLESRIERFVSRSSGSECRCEIEFHLTTGIMIFSPAREVARHQGREQRAV